MCNIKEAGTLTGQTIELGAGNYEIIYELAEEIIEPFTEEQMEVLGSIQTFEGYNNFTTTDDLKPTFSFGYSTSSEEYDYEKIIRDYEYLDYGNYIVYSSEKQEDTYSYKIKCYDKMLYSMKPYENMNITYPITIRNYINALCNYLGLTFANASNTFTNYDKEIPNELYLSYNEDTQEWEDMGYNFRDVFDELAQVTGSVICINKDDEVEIRYPNETNDTIDEEYLKDVNVNFGEKYGPINTVILSRSAGADKIAKSRPVDLPLEDKISVTIEENQILNFDNRDEYLDPLLDRLYGTEYYINDFTSTGICYYDLLDKYNVQIGENTYNCLMLNDEINITQGLEEIVHCNMPEEGDTDYSKTDKTDRKINKTTLIVDKQNQKIEGVISQIGDRSQKTTTITADIDGINSKVEQLEDITDTARSLKTVTLNNCAEGYLYELHVFGNNNVFEALYPSNSLYPSNLLYPKGDSLISVTDENNNISYYNLGVTEVLRQNGNVFDEFVMVDRKAKIIRRINTDGSIRATEQTEELNDVTILLGEGQNTISIVNYSATIDTTWIVQNDFTNKFVPTVSLGTKITQNSKAVEIAWNQISEHIKMIDIDDTASFAIYDKDDNLLMSINRDGQHFYDNTQKVIGDIGRMTYNDVPMIAFNLNVNEETDKGMAWGIEKNGRFYPIFYTIGTYYEEQGEYGGTFYVAGDLEVGDTLKTLIADINQLNATTINVEKITGINDENVLIENKYGDGSWTGHPMAGINPDSIYTCYGDGTNIWFYVDGELITSVSDERLKKEIKPINDKIVDVIGELELYQFKVFNRKDNINVGIIAQELIERCNQYGINAEDYQILRKTKISPDDDQEYYSIDYEQFIILREAYNNKKFKNLENRLKELEGKING